MAVLVVSGDALDQTSVQCVICLQKVCLSTVTVGSSYANGRQAFACNTHLTERNRWITEWALFEAQERQSHDMSLLAEGIL